MSYWTPGFGAIIPPTTVGGWQPDNWGITSRASYTSGTGKTTLQTSWLGMMNVVWYIMCRITPVNQSGVRTVPLVTDYTRVGRLIMPKGSGLHLGQADPNTIMGMHVVGGILSADIATVDNYTLVMNGSQVKLSIVPLPTLTAGTANFQNQPTVFQSGNSGPRLYLNNGLIQVDDGVGGNIIQVQPGGIVLKNGLNKLEIGSAAMKFSNGAYVLNMAASKIELGYASALLTLSSDSIVLTSGLYASNLTFGSSYVNINYGGLNPVAWLNINSQGKAELGSSLSGISCKGSVASIFGTTQTNIGNINGITKFDGSINLDNAGFTNSANVRSKLSAAMSGVNSDITTLAAPGLTFSSRPRFNGQQPGGGVVAATLSNFPSGTAGGNPSAFIEVILNNGAHAIIPAWNLAWV